MVIYAKLMRVDKPIGTLLLLWPTYWALWIASKGVPDADIFIAFTAGTFLMRSAGCVVNDFADRNFDGAVERTKNRPFAKGLVSKTEALLLTVMLCLMAALCLVPLNRFTWLMSLPALFLAVTYPFTKRFFPLPQFYLGLAFSFGIPMAFAAVQGRVLPEAWKDGGVYEGNGTGSQGNRASLASFDSDRGKGRGTGVSGRLSLVRG